jgi:hypothetical protein
MSLFAKLMIASWSSAIAMFGYFALSESGVLLQIRRHLVRWLEAGPASEESLLPGGEDAA